MNANEQIWQDCTICEYFRIIENEQACEFHALTGLPTRFIEGTNKKCCSSFNGKTETIGPKANLLEEGVLYMYSSEDPDYIKEDIDL